jgi:hypothetical protein
MSKARSMQVKPVFVPPSQIVWTDERLATLDKGQLINLLANLQTQRSSGRVSETTAVELEARIKGLLPARAIAVRHRRPRSEVLLEARTAEQLGALATDLAARYDISAETAASASDDVKGFRPQSLTDSKGHARAGSSKHGENGAAFERFVAYRCRDSFVGLAFVLLADQPQERGSYVLLGTDDVLDSDLPANDYTPIAEQHGWSAASRSRMRAEPVEGYAEGAQRFEALVAQLAPVRH